MQLGVVKARLVMYFTGGIVCILTSYVHGVLMTHNYPFSQFVHSQQALICRAEISEVVFFISC